jgi:Transposase DDE domain
MAAAGGATAGPAAAAVLQLPPYERFPRQPDGPRCDADGDRGRDGLGLPRPLRRRRRPGPHHPGRPRHPGRRHGEPADAGPPLAGLLPAALAPPPSHRRHHLRHRREHRGPRRRRHPGLRSLAGLRPADALLRPCALRLRRRPGRIPLPAGAAAAQWKRLRTRGMVAYRADPATCNACPVKAACTASAHGRTVHRSVFADYLEKVRRYHQTPAYQKAMRKRQVRVEPLFAEAKDWHGLRRFRLRGLPNVNFEWCWSRRGRTSSATSPRRAGDGVTLPAGTCWPSPPSPGVRDRPRLTDDPAATGPQPSGPTRPRKACFNALACPTATVSWSAPRAPVDPFAHP